MDYKDARMLILSASKALVNTATLDEFEKSLFSIPEIRVEIEKRSA